MSNQNIPVPDVEDHVVERLLKRPARIAYSIVVRCPRGHPQVLQTHPVFMEEGFWKPFPTFLWLVCPALKLSISRLEQASWIRRFGDRLRTDDAFRSSFSEGHRMMLERRLKLAEGIFGGPLPPPIRRILETTTIAGSRHPNGVKCLHAHAAQFLFMGSNPIGQEVLRLAALGEDCDVCGETARRDGR